MASIRDIRKRIRSVNSTVKITKAMKMVAAARFRRAQASVEQSRPYATKIQELLRDLSGALPQSIHPYLVQKTEGKRVLVVFSSDRGLCGAFNSNVFRRAEAELRADPTILVVPVGKKAIGYFGRRKYTVLKNVSDLWPAFGFSTSTALVKELATQFESKEIRQVDLLFNEFVSVITQRPKMETLLPIRKPETGEALPKSYEFEPSREEIVRGLIPKAVEVRFYLTCLNSLASEFGARMTAMDSASRNARDMIDTLTLSMNRVRQATITKELMEIISGAEALK